MKKITAFRLSDNIIVENEEEAIRLQKEIDLKKAIWDFAQRVGSYEDRDFIYDLIFENADELRKILNNE